MNAGTMLVHHELSVAFLRRLTSSCKPESRFRIRLMSRTDGLNKSCASIKLEKTWINNSKGEIKIKGLIFNLRVLIREPEFCLTSFIRIKGTSALHTHWAISYKMIIQVRYNGNFANKNPLPAMAFKPTTFWLASLSKGHQAAAIRSITLPQLVASTLGDLAEVIKLQLASLSRACTSTRVSVQLLHLQPWANRTT